MLLRQASHVTWIDNYYKEAYTQDNSEDNTLAQQFVPYPPKGGVHLD